MTKSIAITLPVADVSRSTAFFKALGFSHNPQFSSESSTCLVISDSISIMLLAREQFAQFSPKPICDSSTAEALFALGCESKAQVDDLVAKAEKAGGKIHERAVDYGFMYHGSFADLDGHLWALNYLTGAPPQS